MHLLTRLVHQFDAVRLTAYVLEGWDHTDRGTFDFFLAETALSCFLMSSGRLTSVSSMVGILRTKNAIVLCTFVTSQPVQCHMFCGLLLELDALLVLLVVVGPARHDFQDVSTLAFNQLGIVGRGNIQPSLFYFFPRLDADNFLALPASNLRVTGSTLCFIELEIFSLLVHRTKHFIRHLCEARQMEHVEALA